MELYMIGNHSKSISTKETIPIENKKFQFHRTGTGKPLLFIAGLGIFADSNSYSDTLSTTHKSSSYDQ